VSAISGSFAGIRMQMEDLYSIEVEMKNEIELFERHLKMLNVQKNEITVILN
jgi:hypothetical protein